MALIMFPTFSLILKIRFKKCRERKLQIATMKKTADFSKDKPLFFILYFIQLLQRPKHMVEKFWQLAHILLI